MKEKRAVDLKLLENVRSQSCLVCGKRPSEAAHVKSRGAGGGDHVWNVMPLCHRDHQIQHSIGIISFAQKYPQVSRWLHKHGWELTNKLIHLNCDPIIQDAEDYKECEAI